MRRCWSFARSHGVELLGLLAAVEGALEIVLGGGGMRAPRSTPWFAVPAATIIALPLLVRRRWRFGAPVLGWLTAAAVSFVDGRLVVFTAGAALAGMTASFLLGQLPDGGQARIGLAAVLGGTTLIVYNNPDNGPGDLVTIPVLFTIAWLAGFALRERTAQAAEAEERATHAENEREAAARIAVAEERARIARELHDIVAHAVSVIVLQVGAVRHNLPDVLREDKETLTGVERTGRTALAEMRRLLGAMRPDHEGLDLAPQPGLGGLDALMAEFRRAGLPVRIRFDGEPRPLPGALDLSAYRVVQEGLTNTLRHARASHADVVIRYHADRLQIEVHDDGRGSPPGDGLGHGLLGVGERVKIYRGEMTAGTGKDGGFTLSTTFPLDGDPR